MGMVLNKKRKQEQNKYLNYLLFVASDLYNVIDGFLTRDIPDMHINKHIMEDFMKTIIYMERAVAEEKPYILNRQK